jgi:hypothetical protein
VNLSGSREQVGLLPFYLSLSGNDVTIWTDDPSFTAAENPDEQTFNPLEGLRATGLVREDITGAYTVNDFRTRGNGLKLNFTEESGLEFTTEASQIISSGFALVIDGQPVASQSYPMTSQLFTQGYSGPYTVYMTNFISGEKIQFQAIASIINNEPLPLVATVETSTNSNIQSLIDVDPLQMKGILFAALILSLIIIFIKFRYNAIIPIVFAGNSLILSIGIMKLMGLYLNINLIIGVIIGLGLLYLLGMIALKKLLKVEKSKSEIIAKASSEFRWSTLKFLLAILLMTLLIDVFEISFAKQLSFGIGVMTVTGLISLFSVFRAFVNELFILPSTVGDAK